MEFIENIKCRMENTNIRNAVKIIQKMNLIKQTQNDPEIVLLAQKVKTQYQQNIESDTRQLLAQIYHSVKLNPSQLRNIKDYSSIHYFVKLLFIYLIISKILAE